MSALATVDFHGDTLEAVKDKDGTIWVSIKRCCENLGLDRATQMLKLKKKDWAVRGQKPLTGPDGKIYEVDVIDLTTLPGWLFSIDSRRVKPEIKDKLVKYQRECAKVLADHFLGTKQAEQAAEPKPIASNEAPAIVTTKEQLDQIKNDMRLEMLTAIHGDWLYSQARCRHRNLYHIANLYPQIDAIAVEMVRQCLAQEPVYFKGIPVYFSHQMKYVDQAIELVQNQHRSILNRKQTDH